MKLKRVLGLVFCAIWINAACLRADIIEIKDEGFVSGEIVSEDENQMTFKDAHGNTRVIPKTNIGMVEHEDKLRKWKEIPADIAQKVSSSMSRTKEKAESTTKKVKSKVTAPLDRSKAQDKADALSDAFKKANEASAAMSKKNNLVAQEMKASAEGTGSSSGSAVKSKGRFESL